MFGHIFQMFWTKVADICKIHTFFMKLTIFKKLALSLAVIEFIYNTLNALAQFYA